MLTYVITTLLRGDDIEQVEYVICQLIELSAQPRQILVFNGGRYPKGQHWLEWKYPKVRVLELDVPESWELRSEYHYYHFVCTQLHKYMETEYYLKMDRDVCVFARGFDRILLDFMRKRPNVAAAGVCSLTNIEHKLKLDELNLLQELPCSVSYHNTKLLNGGVELFKTSSMNHIGPTLDKYGKWLWREKYLDLAEDDLISFVLQGMEFQIQDCLYLGAFRGDVLPEPKCDGDTLYNFNAYINAKEIEFCIVHGFKPFVKYRRLYKIMHGLLGRRDVIKVRNEPSNKDICCINR